MTTTTMTKESFQFFYRNLSKDTSLMRTLVNMQSGVSERKAYEIADQVIRDVAAFEGTLASLDENTLAVVNSFLQESPVLQGENRMLQLHRLHFGLKVHADSGLEEALKEGIGAGTQFEQYYATAGQDETITEEVLTDAIRQQLAQLAVSPDIMTAIARKLEEGNGVLANAAAISAEGQRFQCILAMQLYLNNRNDGMTTAEAAALACTANETQAIADAAGHGLLTKQQVTQAIELLAACIVLFGFLCHFGFFTALAGHIVAGAGTTLANNAFSILLVGYLVSMVSDALGALAGKLSATYHFTHAAEHAEMMEGLRRMGDALKEKAGEMKDRAMAAVDSIRPTANQDENLFDEDVDTAGAI